MCWRGAVRTLSIEKELGGDLPANLVGRWGVRGSDDQNGPRTFETHKRHKMLLVP